MSSTNNPALEDNLITVCDDCHKDTSTVVGQKTEIPYAHEGLAEDITRFKKNVDEECRVCDNKIPSYTWIYHLPADYYGQDQVTVEPVCGECFREYIQNNNLSGKVVAEAL